MGSKFFRWFSKLLQKRTNVTDSTNIYETNDEFPASAQETDSVSHCLDLQQNVEKTQTVEEQSIAKSQQAFDLGYSEGTSAWRWVHADDSSRNIKPGSPYNETDTKSDEMCLTFESSQSLFHTEVSKNAQASTMKLETINTTNACACDASVNNDIHVDTLSSSSDALLCMTSDFLPVEPSVYSGLTADEIAVIENDIEIHLNRMCPTTYYDFCLITCDIDYEEATVFRSEFCRAYNLMGCMLFDDEVASLGDDIFEQYEAMMKRSTKVFFYHTENYKKDNIHRRVQNGAVFQQLWEQMCKDKDKCVPVFPYGSHGLGLALSGISGLDPTLPEHMHRRVLATFTDRVRKVRVLKEAEAKRRRSVLYKELCGCMGQYYKEKKYYLSRQGKSLSMKTQVVLSNEHTRRQELEIPPFPNTELSHLKQVLTSLSIEEEAKNRIYKFVSESCNRSLAYDAVCSSDIKPSPNNSSSGVTILESSNIHVGPRIELNVHVTGTGEGDSCLGTDCNEDT